MCFVRLSQEFSTGGCVSGHDSDRDLGMHKPISRRDFLNGRSVGLGANLVASGTFWSGVLAAEGKPYAPEKDPNYYTPTTVGKRDGPDGSWNDDLYMWNV